MAANHAKDTVKNAARPQKQKMTPLEKSWILYDVGNSAFTLIGAPLPRIVFLAVFVVVKSAYSTSPVFYDSMLCDVTTRERLDKLSAQGYAPGGGYIGGCIPFIIFPPSGPVSLSGRSSFCSPSRMTVGINCRANFPLPRFST